MNQWTRRLLGALPIIGAGAGLTVLVTAAASVEQWNALMAVIIIGFALFYLMGAVAGLLLLSKGIVTPLRSTSSSGRCRFLS